MKFSKNILIIILLTCLWLFNGSTAEGRDDDYRRGDGESRNIRRSNRFSRLHRRRIQDDPGNPTLGPDRFDNLKYEDLPQPPQDIFQDMKANGRLVEEGENHAQYEEYLDDADIYSILSEELVNVHEEADGGDDDEAERRRMVILGSDTRFELTGNPITSSPSKYVGRFRFASGSSTYQCSGILVGNGWVLTAGHCVHEGNGGSWYVSKRFAPGLNRLQSTSEIYTQTCWAFTGWTVSGLIDWDFALCKLWSVPGVGGSGFGYDTALSSSDYFYIRGYPGDKPSNEMWGSNDYLSTTSANRLYCDECDTFGGMSGGPWVRSSNVAVYGTHHGGSSSAGWNVACRIDKFKFDWMCEKMAPRC